MCFAAGDGNSTVTSQSTIFEEINKLTLEQLKKKGNEMISVQDLSKTLDKDIEIIDIADPLTDSLDAESTNPNF